MICLRCLARAIVLSSLSALSLFPPQGRQCLSNKGGRHKSCSELNICMIINFPAVFFRADLNYLRRLFHECRLVNLPTGHVWPLSACFFFHLSCNLLLHLSCLNAAQTTNVITNVNGGSRVQLKIFTINYNAIKTNDKLYELQLLDKTKRKWNMEKIHWIFPLIPSLIDFSHLTQRLSTGYVFQFQRKRAQWH